MLAAFALAGGVVNAEGTTLVQRSDGSSKTYRDVSIRLVGQTLWLRSADHKGVLEIASGACSFAGGLERCLPFKTTLHQRGKTREIPLKRGTVYVNLTDAVDHLPHSSEPLAPHGILAHFETMHGTYVSVRGSLDQGKW
jgi:hypothetical protein